MIKILYRTLFDCFRKPQWIVKEYRLVNETQFVHLDDAQELASKLRTMTDKSQVTLTRIFLLK